MNGTEILTVVPHPRREWLVSVGDRRFAVSPRVGRLLQPLAGRPAAMWEILDRLQTAAAQDKHGREEATALAAQLADPSRARTPSRRRAIWLRRRLVPAAAVDALALRLARLAAWPALASLGTIGAVGYLLAGGIGSDGGAAPATTTETAGSIVLGLGLFLVTALWHELGHAAALRREGYPPGGIGAGILFVIPVFYADVTSVGALSRSGRIRVDVAGVCFQLGVGGLLFALGVLADGIGLRFWLILAPRLAGLSALAAVLWSLIPFLRSDGHWLLADVLGLDSLDGAAPPDRGRAVVAALLAYRLANLVFLLLVGVVLPLRFGRLATRLLALVWEPAARPETVSIVAASAMFLLMAPRLWSSAASLLHLAVADVRRFAAV